MGLTTPPQEPWLSPSDFELWTFGPSGLALPRPRKFRSDATVTGWIAVDTDCRTLLVQNTTSFSLAKPSHPHKQLKCMTYAVHNSMHTPVCSYCHGTCPKYVHTTLKAKRKSSKRLQLLFRPTGGHVWYLELGSPTASALHHSLIAADCNSHDLEISSNSTLAVVMARKFQYSVL